MFEQLEARNLLTLSFWSVELYQDDNGCPGLKITDDTVIVGEQFHVRIFAEDRRVDPQPIAGVQPGIAGASIDVDWDSSLLTLLDLQVTDDLPIFRGQQVDSGHVNDLRGASFSSAQIGRPIGGLVPEEFADLRFDAGFIGDTQIGVDIGADGVAMLPYVYSRLPFQHVFSTQDVHVVYGCKAIEPIPERR